MLSSADGRFIAFESFASDLLPEDSRHETDVYLYDRGTGEMRLVSALPTGFSSSEYAFLRDFSANGRFVLFSSGAQLTATAPARGGVYIYDAAYRSLISLPPGVGGDEISGDGNLVASTGSCPSVYNRTTGVTVYAGCTGSTAYWEFSLSSDGSTLVWSALSPNAPNPSDWLAPRSIYAFSVSAGTTKVVSTDSCGRPLPGRAMDPVVSGDGRFVAFTLDGTLGPACPVRLEGGSQVYVKDLRTGAIDLASASTGGVPGDTYSDSAGISDDGRFVTFRSSSTTVDPTNYIGLGAKFYVRDRLLLTTSTIGLDTGDYPSQWEADISADGSTIVFTQFPLVAQVAERVPPKAQVWYQPNPAPGWLVTGALS